MRNSRVFIGEISYGGEGGIRTPGRSFSPYNGLANRRLQPLGHLSAANFSQHCSLLPHLVTVSPSIVSPLSIAAFWCTRHQIVTNASSFATATCFESRFVWLSPQHQGWFES